MLLSGLIAAPTGPHHLVIEELEFFKLERKYHASPSRLT